MKGNAVYELERVIGVRKDDILRENLCQPIIFKRKMGKFALSRVKIKSAESEHSHIYRMIVWHWWKCVPVE